MQNAPEAPSISADVMEKVGAFSTVKTSHHLQHCKLLKPCIAHMAKSVPQFRVPPASWIETHELVSTRFQHLTMLIQQTFNVGLHSSMLREVQPTLLSI